MYQRAINAICLSVATAAAVLLCAEQRVVHADVFVLENGGRVEGQWINRTDQSPQTYVIQTASGGRVTLDRDQVKRVVRPSADELEYDRIAPKTPLTVEDQWRMAEWCRNRRLLKRHKAHLKNILRIDPDQPQARAALGYSRLNNEWVTPQQRRERLGMIYYRGSWRLAQEAAVLEMRRKKELAENGYLAKLKRWREDLSTDKAAAARENILAMDDPRAVPALALALASDTHRWPKLLYVEALAQIAEADADAAGVLVAASLDDPDVEVREACLDRIVAIDPAGAPEKYVEALQDNNNFRVNRAASALARLDHTPAMGPLIDALVTTHWIDLRRPSRRNSQPITTSFVNPLSGGGGPLGAMPSPGTGLAVHSGPGTIVQQIPNEDVLSALVTLSDGVNFSFHSAAWKAWLAGQEAQMPTLNPRRD